MNPIILMKIDPPVSQFLSLLLLLLALGGCNDGGIVGTGSGKEPAADKQPIEIAGSPATDAAGVPIEALSSVDQEKICNSIPSTQPGRLSGVPSTTTVELESSGAATFSCTWRTASVASANQSGKVTVTITSNPAFWQQVINDSTGKYPGPNPEVLNNGYLIHSIDECLHGIVIPPESGLAVSIRYENPTACHNGTDLQRATILAALNQLGRDALETLRKILK